MYRARPDPTYTVMPDAILDQIRFALIEREIEHTLDGRRFAIDYGSAEIQIDVVDAPPAPTVALRAAVLLDISVDDPEAELALLRSLNDRNARLRFGKFYFDLDHSQIVVEYEILGTHLQSEEVLHALAVVATLADDHDDTLLDELGQGKRASDIAGRAEAARAF